MEMCTDAFELAFELHLLKIEVSRGGDDRYNVRGLFKKAKLGGTT